MDLFLPKTAKFITSIFKAENISEFRGEKQHLWVEISKKSYKEELKIRRGLPLGFSFIRSEHVKFKHETETTKKKEKRKRTLYHRTYFGSSQKQRRQLCGSLNRYGFAYARRYKVNEATKAAPGVIKAATNDIKNIAEKRTNQIISEGGKQSECVLPKILRGTTDNVYQRPFTLLGEFFYLRFIT